MSNQAWLDNLKVGDTVIQRSSGAIGSRDSIGTVDRLTKTYIITKNGSRYKTDGGSTPGAGYHHGRIEEPTEEKTNEIHRVNLANNLNHYSKWEDLSLETLRVIKNAINKGVTS